MIRSRSNELGWLLNQISGRYSRVLQLQNLILFFTAVSVFLHNLSDLKVNWNLTDVVWTSICGDVPNLGVAKSDTWKHRFISNQWLTNGRSAFTNSKTEILLYGNSCKQWIAEISCRTSSGYQIQLRGRPTSTMRTTNRVVGLRNGSASLLSCCLHNYTGVYEKEQIYLRVTMKNYNFSLLCNLGIVLVNRIFR